jgi:murein DD-endopeptidase MepM/ murein hydrolase activator NlpD
MAPAVAVLAVSVAVVATPSAIAARACWLPPVHGRIVDPYREPACRWCAGNRGIEYAVGPGAPVRSVATGVVTYSGVVVRTRYVVVDIGAGRRITYGGLASARVRRGDRVVARTIIGTAVGTLFFGLRVHGAYTDPSPFLGRLVGRPRLVPSDGSAARPAPPATVRCGSAGPRNASGSA